MIYAIECEGTAFYKIGFTDRNPKHRLAQLQTGCPMKLKLAAVIDGTKAQEAVFHERLRHTQYRLEWFDLSKSESARDIVEHFFGVKVTTAGRISGDEVKARRDISNGYEVLCGIFINLRKAAKPRRPVEWPDLFDV
jgi:hypothetical protein